MENELKIKLLIKVSLKKDLTDMAIASKFKTFDLIISSLKCLDS